MMTSDLHNAINIEVGDALHESDNLLNHRLDDVEENTRHEVWTDGVNLGKTKHCWTEFINLYR